MRCRASGNPVKLPLIAYLPLALLVLMVRFSIEQPQARSASSRPTSLPTEIPPLTTKPASPPQTNPLQDASDKAVGAAVITQSAQSKYDWDAVAELMQEAITLTKAVPKSSSDYALAQKQLIQYQHSFAYAKQQAIKTAPNSDLAVVQTPNHTVSAQRVAQKQSSPTVSIKAVAQEQLVSIIPSNPTTGVLKLRQVKAVVGQFFALDARLDVGMHYREYGDRVAELKVALDGLGRQPGATNLPAYNSLRAALTNYETALDTWSFCINEYHCVSDSPEAASTAGNLSPEASISSSDTPFLQGQLIPVADADSNWKDKSYLKTTISAIWVAAREHLETAQRQL